MSHSVYTNLTVQPISDWVFPPWSQESWRKQVVYSRRCLWTNSCYFVFFFLFLFTYFSRPIWVTLETVTAQEITFAPYRKKLTVSHSHTVLQFSCTIFCPLLTFRASGNVFFLSADNLPELQAIRESISRTSKCSLVVDEKFWIGVSAILEQMSFGLIKIQLFRLCCLFWKSVVFYLKRTRLQIQHSPSHLQITGQVKKKKKR